MITYSLHKNLSSHICTCLFVCLRNSPQWARAPSFTRFLDHTKRVTIGGRTPLDEWSARRRDLYLTTHNTHNRQTSMPPGGIRTHDLSRRAAADLSLRPRGHWDRHKNVTVAWKLSLTSPLMAVTHYPSELVVWNLVWRYVMLILTQCARNTYCSSVKKL